jgi:hypothetical protein
VTAEEKLLALVPGSTSVFSLPAAPFCITGEKNDLYNAAIELHY